MNEPQGQVQPRNEPKQNKNDAREVSSVRDEIIVGRICASISFCSDGFLIYFTSLHYEEREDELLLRHKSIYT